MEAYSNGELCEGGLQISLVVGRIPAETFLLKTLFLRC